VRGGVVSISFGHWARRRYRVRSRKPRRAQSEHGDGAIPRQRGTTPACRKQRSAASPISIKISAARGCPSRYASTAVRWIFQITAIPSRSNRSKASFSVNVRRVLVCMIEKYRNNFSKTLIGFALNQFFEEAAGQALSHKQRRFF
jgi:hypothetical protein